MYFNVNILISAFTFIVRQLMHTANKQEAKADNIQKSIDVLSNKKRVALNEAVRARKVADNIESLLA